MLRKINNISFSVVLGLLLTFTSCQKFDEMTNPNEMTNDSFWLNESDAVKGVNAVYASLMRNGTYKKWFYFVTDASSDEGMSTSPWTELCNVSKFTYTNYSFEVLHEIFQDHYRGIFRANQAIVNLPHIDMDENLKKRLLGEAKFIRALLYYNLVNLWGDVPLATETAKRTNSLAGYPQQGIPAVWELIEKDLEFAIDALPKKYDNANLGRATWGAAKSLLGKAYMQQHKWVDAEGVFFDVIDSKLYDLTPNYKDNFTHNNENNIESIFEVQFSDVYKNTSAQDGAANSSLGCYRSIFLSPAGWSDIEGNKNMLNYFKKYNDPRLVSTYIYDNTDEVYYGGKYADLEMGARAGSQWFRKYGRDYYLTQDEEKTWDSPINIRVIRYADILLLYAEALVNNNKSSLAVDRINEVRNRVGAGESPFIAEGMSMAKVVENERIMELCGESIRIFDLRRLGYFENETGENSIATLQVMDQEFNFFNINTKGYLPFPDKETNTNPDVDQNEGW